MLAGDGTMPVTERGLRTRAELVKAARAEFERNGYFETSIQDIARRAKVAYGTFYTYFAAKEEVFDEVVADLVVSYRTIAEAEPRSGADPASLIARANAGYLHAYRQNASMMAILEQVASFNPRLREIRRQARRYWVDRGAAAIAAWQSQGLARADLDPQYAASALGSMVDRSAYVWFVLGEPFEEDKAIEQLTLLYCAALGLARPSNGATSAEVPRRQVSCDGVDGAIGNQLT